MSRPSKWPTDHQQAIAYVRVSTDEQARDGVHLEPDHDEQAVIALARALRQAGLSSRKIAARRADRGLYSRVGTVFDSKAILTMVAA
jgi:DNA invertase Pin-like site-specific DNA recombinase